MLLFNYKILNFLWTNKHHCLSPACHPSHTLSTPSGLCHADTHNHTHTPKHTHARGRVDATLSAEHWGVLLLTAGRIKTAVHPLLSDGCGAAGLAFVLGSIMAHYNYSVSRGGSIYLFHPLPHLTSAGQQGWTHCQRSSFMCVCADLRCVCLRLTGIATRQFFSFFVCVYLLCHAAHTKPTHAHADNANLWCVRPVYTVWTWDTGLFTHWTTVWFPMKHANASLNKYDYKYSHHIIGKTGHQIFSIFPISGLWLAVTV